MQDEQVSLANNFVNFINVLNQIEGGLPNVHIGVVSTDTGAISAVGGCDDAGDQGALQNTPQVGGCTPPTDAYISDIDNNGTRVTNYGGGPLADTFSCIAQLGTQGCGFETPLESMRLALNGTTNAGFLRQDAFLAVIFITDEDDCSSQDRNGFFANQNAGVNDPLGPLSSFRCFEFGIRCNPDDPRPSGPKEECLPREDSPYLIPVQEYVDFLVNLKPAGQVIVAGIFGLPEDSPGGNGFRATVVPNDSGGQLGGTPKLGPACESSAGEAAPGIRLKQFVDAFVQSRTTTICNADLSDALTAIADLLAEVIGTPCLSNNVVLPPDCVGWLEDTEGETLRLLDECTDASQTDCYAFLEGLAECATEEAGDTELGVEYRPTGDEPFGTRFRLQCVGDAI